MIKMSDNVVMEDELADESNLAFQNKVFQCLAYLNIFGRPRPVYKQTQLSYIKLYILIVISLSETGLVHQFRKAFLKLNLFYLACAPFLQVEHKKPATI